MTDTYQRAASTAERLIKKYGSAATVTKYVGEYDDQTRRRDMEPVSQSLNAILMSRDIGSSRDEESLKAKHDRVMVAAPSILSGTAFEPEIGHVVEKDGKWSVQEARIVKFNGVTILYKLGLKAA